MQEVGTGWDAGQTDSDAYLDAGGFATVYYAGHQLLRLDMLLVLKQEKG